MRWYAAVIFLSAMLLFEVQPIVARMLLPRLGGSASVWTTCLLFFQTGLLAGYFHAWWTGRYLSPRARAQLQAVLLLLSLVFLPIAPPPAAVQTRAPIWQLLLLLLRTVGLPYILLSSTGPLLQDWFAARFPGRDPYRLFALSNLASLLALLLYPVAIEPYFGVTAQARAWSLFYLLYVGLSVAVALGARSLPPIPAQPIEPRPEPAPPLAQPVPNYETDPVPPLREGLLSSLRHSFRDPPPSPVEPTPGVRALWVALPANATLLLLALTTYLTEDLAAIPLLWVLPLSVYLVTFILAFERRRYYLRPVFRPLFVVTLSVLAWLRFTDERPRLTTALAVWLFGLFIVCMVLHGELSRLKPRVQRLTAYYLSISVGGALGGLVVVVLAPLVFPIRVELELALLGSAVLLIVPAAVDAAEREKLARSPMRAVVAGTWVVAVAVALAIGLGDEIQKPRLAARNFYGAVRVMDVGAPDKGGVRELYHGSTTHGSQRLKPEWEKDPLTYYCAQSGAGLALVHHHADRPRRIGVVGLGIGGLAAWGKAGDQLRFYEINPLIEKIAREQFSYLKNTPATVSVVLGDARLSLAAEEPNRFDVLLIDAFSSDAIPLHLVTREAFGLYFRHLAPDGILAVHISNRYLDLGPVVAAGAEAFGRTAELVVSFDASELGVYCFRTRWVLIGAPASLFTAPEVESHVPQLPRADLAPWTDDYSNVFSVLLTR